MAERDFSKHGPLDWVKEFFRNFSEVFLIVIIVAHFNSSIKFEWSRIFKLSFVLSFILTFYDWYDKDGKDNIKNSLLFIGHQLW